MNRLRGRAVLPHTPPGEQVISPRVWSTPEASAWAGLEKDEPVIAESALDGLRCGWRQWPGSIPGRSFAGGGAGYYWEEGPISWLKSLCTDMGEEAAYYGQGAS